MQGIILAAGMGSRLKKLTQKKPKCMVEVSGVTLIERALKQLDKLHLNRIVIVTGYSSDILTNFANGLDIVTPIVYVNNDIYDQTNNIYSLYLAKDFLESDDTLLLESDLIFEEGILEKIINDKEENLALVDKYESWMDGTCLIVGENGEIESFVPGRKFDFTNSNNYYKTVNIYKFSKDFSSRYYVPFLDAYSKALGYNEYYEEVLRIITILDNPIIKAKKLNGELWYEIDDEADLDIAESFFPKDDYDRLDKIQYRYGGYWRYPKLTDFCCPINSFYPPQKMKDEIVASFNSLVTQYPSGNEVNSLLAGKIYGIDHNMVIVGNGIPELIREIMNQVHGKVGIIQTAFNEYTRRVQGEKIVYTPDSEDFSYTVNDLIRYFSKRRVDSLIISNPDNSSGNFILRNDMEQLVQWCDNNGITIVVDESFIDYAEWGYSLLEEDVLAKYKKLVVIRSISEPHGMPGIRLGILASADQEIIDNIRQNISIWNVNSIAEFYMQIFEKYKKQYLISLAEIIKERKRFIEQLSLIEGIRVIESQSNHLMVEITNGLTARDVTKMLLNECNILVKDLSVKRMNINHQYIRIAIRSSKENDNFVCCLTNVLKVGS